MAPQSEEFEQAYFTMMRKFAMCFDYIDIRVVDSLLGWTRIPYYGANGRVEYPEIKGFLDMQYGPLFMYLNHLHRIRILASHHQKRRPVRDLRQAMSDILSEVKHNFGYHVMRVKQYLNAPESCNPILGRAVIEREHLRESHVRLNGMTLVPLTGVEDVVWKGLEIHSNKVLTVRGIGKGIPLLDLVNPISNPVKTGEPHNSLYNPPPSAARHKIRPIVHPPKWGPLYPSIIFPKATEMRVLDPSWLLASD
jgi:hypothetical protein